VPRRDGKTPADLCPEFSLLLVRSIEEGDEDEEEEEKSRGSGDE
jgi:hypothetical protein